MAANRKRKAAALKEENEGKAQEDAPRPLTARPVIVFAHGAGAGSKSDFMIRWKKLLEDATNAVEVITFDYPYLAGGKRGSPPKAEKLVEFHRGLVDTARQNHPGSPVVLCGKSMGSRVGCMVAGREEEEITAVVCLGYPLKGINGKIRDETLVELKAPVMFVQGTRDNMCPLDALEAVRMRMHVHTELHVVEGGDHSLAVGVKRLKEAGMTAAKVEEKAVAMVAKFVQEQNRAKGGGEGGPGR